MPDVNILNTGFSTTGPILARLSDYMRMPPAEWTSGPLASYLFQGTAAEAAVDLSGHGNNLIVHGAPVMAAKGLGATTAHGTNYFEVPFSNPLSVTYVALVRRIAPSLIGAACCNYKGGQSVNPSDYAGDALLLRGEDIYMISNRSAGNGGSDTGTVSVSGIPQDEWIFISGSALTATPAVEVRYGNGGTLTPGTDDTSTGARSTVAGRNLLVGSSYMTVGQSGAPTAPITIGALAIFDTARTDSDAATLYASLRSWGLAKYGIDI